MYQRSRTNQSGFVVLSLKFIFLSVNNFKTNLKYLFYWHSFIKKLEIYFTLNIQVYFSKLQIYLQVLISFVPLFTKGFLYSIRTKYICEFS